MYIQRSEASVSKDAQEEMKAREAKAHELMATMPGFRWAMLLSPLVSPGPMAAVSMWLSQEQASDQDSVALGAGAETHGYEVATARGSMTPATHMVLVDWQIDDAVAQAFTNRWNAFYHAIEDRIGSRLLRDLESPGRYAGVHVMTDESHLNLEMFGAEIKDSENLSVRPVAVHGYRVELLSEGS